MRTNLTGRTVLIAPSGSQRCDLAAELEHYGARVIACPSFEPSDPESYVALDEAIENLYGYDWLIFASAAGVEFFLRRLQHLRREIHELDSIRVCAIADATVRELEQSRIHIDLLPQKFSSAEVFTELQSYAGGAGNLGGLNFLMPRAAIARDPLKDLLENAGARVDMVAAYRTVREINSELARINTLLTGGGIDCVVFGSRSEVLDFAGLFDANDLSAILKDTEIAAIDETTSQAIAEHGLRATIKPSEQTIPAVAREIAVRLSS
jgi:uroporphyrinogen III methyltransferase / synthase